MTVANLRLDTLPIEFDSLRKLAPRSDGLDSVSSALKALGFSATAAIGDVVTAVDLDALRITVGGLPPGVTRVSKIVLSRSIMTGLPSLGRDILGKPAGTPVWVEAGAAQWAIAVGIATAA